MKQIIKLGMQVTVVLDCCFSGSVSRKEEMRRTDIRFLEYDPAVEARGRVFEREKICRGAPR